MGRLPDLTPLFYLALIGIATCVIGGLGLVGWAGYHLFRAFSLYLGAPS